MTPSLAYSATAEAVGKVLTSAIPQGTDVADTTETTETKDSAPDITKAVAEAVQESMNKALEQMKASFEERLTKIEESARPGGPQRVVVTPDTAKTEEALRKAAYYDALADNTADAKLAEGYRILADKSRKAAA
jgi:hypothetical protein